MKLGKKILGMLLVMGLVAAVVTGCGKSKGKNEDAADSYEPVVEKLCDAKSKADLEGFLSLFGPMKSLMGSVVTQDVLDGTLQAYKTSCGENISLEYSITDEAAASKDEIATYEDNVSIFSGNEEVTISSAYNLTVDVDVKGDSGNSEYTMDIAVGEIDGEWIIVNFNDTLLK